jgi:hypothetical protein
VVTSSRDDDVDLDYCLSDRNGRTEFDPSRDHVARDYQRFRVWWRVGVLFLFQTQHRRLFSRAARST